MSFAWPAALLALLAVPLVLGVAWWTRRRKRRSAVRVTSIALVRAALPGRSRWRRRIPVALLVLGLAVLAVGAARPQASVAVPSSRTTILLALDVSGSMCSTDVPPNRLTAAEQAAAEFIKAQPSGARIGLVAFAGVAGLLVPPTTDTDALLTALPDLTTSRGTAIGQAVLTSIDAIADVDGTVPPTGADPGPPGGYAADVIVVLTDGANTQGVEPPTAAQEAAARGVRVYTIGFGTTDPAPLVCSADQVGDFPGGGAGGPFGGGGGRGGRSPLIADDDSLKQVAATTGGQFYKAEDAGQLQEALADLPRSISLTHADRDLAALFAGLGGLLIATAIALSLWWNRLRPPPPPA